MVFTNGDVRIERRTEAGTACDTIDSGVDIPPEVLSPHPFRPHLHRIGELVSSEREKSERPLGGGRPASGPRGSDSAPVHNRKLFRVHSWPQCSHAFLRSLPSATFVWAA
jgi:hypothetical protein